jgi:hypothetical protein
MPGVLIFNNTAPVAQWKEQRSSKPKVVGSNPAGGAWVGVFSRGSKLLLEVFRTRFPLNHLSRNIFLFLSIGNRDMLIDWKGEGVW